MNDTDLKSVQLKREVVIRCPQTSSERHWSEECPAKKGSSHTVSTDQQRADQKSIQLKAQTWTKWLSFAVCLFRSRVVAVCDFRLRIPRFSYIKGWQFFWALCSLVVFRFLFCCFSLSVESGKYLSIWCLSFSTIQNSTSVCIAYTCMCFCAIEKEKKKRFPSYVLVRVCGQWKTLTRGTGTSN